MSKSQRPWQVSLQVTSPERPALRHQLEYRAAAVDAPTRERAIDLATRWATREGHTVVAVVAAVRGY